MNENEMNQQNATMRVGSQVDPNVMIKPIDTLMDDFENAVQKQPEPVVVPVNTEPVRPVEEPVVSVAEPEIQVQPETVIPEPVVESEEILKGHKKNDNWTFIIALFAIVGLFVILLPLLVRLFGY